MSEKDEEDIASLIVQNERLERALKLTLVPIDVLHEMMRAKHLFAQPFQQMIQIAWEEGHKCLKK